MATRHNLCPNPACQIDTTGWTGNSTPPARQEVTGFPRASAAHYSAGSVAFGPTAAATPGLTYTVSVYVRPVNFPINATLYIEWLNSGGGSIGFSGVAFSAAVGQVTRISQSGTAVTNTAGVHFVVSGENYEQNPTYYSCHLAEQSATLEDYFDGDSPNASWDGTPGASTSTLTDEVAVEGQLDAALPPAGATLTAEASAEGVLAAGLPAATAALEGTVTVAAGLDATLPAVEAAAEATAEATAELHATLPATAAALTGHAGVGGQLDADLPAITAALAGSVEVRADLTAALPALEAGLAGLNAGPEAVFDVRLPALQTALSGQVPVSGTLEARLPALTAVLAATSDATPPAIPDVTVGPPRLRQPAGQPRLGAVLVSPPRIGGAR